MTVERIVLQQLNEPGRNWSVTAHLNDTGDLIIEGHDLSADLAALFGEGTGEYEYSITVRSAHLPDLLRALDRGADLFPALQARFGPPDLNPVRRYLDAQGIAYEFWSRLGG